MDVMKQHSQLDLQNLVNEEGVAGVAEALGRIAEQRAAREFGGAPDSITATQRKAWQKAAVTLSSVAAYLRRDC
jgi:hypothetical protein